MSEERIGTEVNMDEYMTKAEYATKFPGVVDEATHANTAQGCNNAFALGGERPEHYAAKSDVTELESRINVALVGKVDKDDGKGLSTEDYTTAEKEKLAGIEAGANNYVHPATHPASMIEGLPEVVQGTGPSTTAVMSQKAVTDAVLATDNRTMAAQTTANNAQASATQAQGTATNAVVAATEAKCAAAAAQTTASNAIPKTDIVQEPGGSEAKVMSQKAVTEALNRKVATVNGQGPDTDGNVVVPQIESGSNANGSYTKFPDGTMVCAKILSFHITTAPTGNIFYRNFTPTEMGDWAQPFIDANIVPSLTVKSDVLSWCGGMNPTAVQIGWVGLCTQNPITNSPVTLRFMAIGRWK